MSGVFFREVLPDEDVSQMSAAVGALNLCAHAVRVRQPLNRAWDLLVETWPTTARLKLVLRTIQRSAAAFADIGAFIPESKVFTGERHLRTLLDYDTFLFTSKPFRFILRSRHKITN